MTKFQQNITFYFFLIVGIAIRGWILLMPEEQMMARWGSDDMFYYTQVAGHFFDDGKISFDGINVGSGIQPLFFLLLVPFGKLLLNNPENSIAILFSLITILNIATAFLIRRGISTIAKKQILGVIVASIFIIHPKIVSVCYQGTEAALSFFVLIMMLLAWYQLLLSEKKIITTVLLFSLCVLTRFDFAFLLFGMGGVFFLQKKIKLLTLIKVSILPLFCMLGWMFFLYHQTGSYRPDSAVGKQLHMNFIFQELEYIEGGRMITSVKNLLQALILPFRAEQSLSFTTILVFLGGGMALFRYRKPLHLLGIKKMMPSFIVGSILNLVVLISVLCFYREWYVVPLFCLFMLLTGGMIISVFDGQGSMKWMLPFLLLISIGWWSEANLSSRKFLYHTDYEVLNWARKNLPKGLKIGAFNSGFYGSYLGTDYDVINLDGLVNHSVLESYRSKSLVNYMNNQQIDYVIDRTKSIEFYAKMGGEELMSQLDLVKEFESPEKRLFGIYKFKRD